MRTPAEADPDVSLTVARPEDDARPPSRWTYLPWPVAAIAWTLGAAVAAWVVSATLPVAAWVAAARTPALAVFDATGQTWLAAHLAPAHLGGVTIGLAPLGITALLIAACAAAAYHAADQFTLPEDADDAARLRAVAAVAGTCVATYVVAALIMAPIVGGADQVGPAIAGAFAVVALGALPGATLGLDVHPLDAAPAWVSRLPRAASWGLGVLALGAAVAAATALIAHWPRVLEVQQSLGADGPAAVMLTLVQLAYLPTLLLWAGSFVLGAGLTLGPGTLLSPGHVELGTLPALPVFGALPPTSGPADWAWLSVGVLAGAAAGVVMVRGTGATWLEGTWRGALAGLATGLLWALASWFAVGDLGSRVLVDLGPRFPELWAFALGPLTLAGALGGLAVPLVRRARAGRGEQPEAG